MTVWTCRLALTQIFLLQGMKWHHPILLSNYQSYYISLVIRPFLEGHTLTLKPRLSRLSDQKVFGQELHPGVLIPSSGPCSNHILSLGYNALALSRKHRKPSFSSKQILSVAVTVSALRLVSMLAVLVLTGFLQAFLSPGSGR